MHWIVYINLYIQIFVEISCKVDAPLKLKKFILFKTILYMCVVNVLIKKRENVPSILRIECVHEDLLFKEEK